MKRALYICMFLLLIINWINRITKCHCLRWWWYQKKNAFNFIIRRQQWKASFFPAAELLELVNISNTHVSFFSYTQIWVIKYMWKNTKPKTSLLIFLLPTTPTLESYNYECFHNFYTIVFAHTVNKGGVCNVYKSFFCIKVNKLLRTILKD